MGNHQDGEAARVEPLEQPHDLLPGLRVQRARRLIGQQKHWLIHQRPRDGHPLLLPAGELGRVMMHPVCEPQGLQGRLRFALAFLAGGGGIEQRQGDVVQGAGAGEEIEGLEHEADFGVSDAGQFVLLQFPHRVAVEDVPARGGRIEASQQVHEGGLAGAGRTGNGHELSRLDRDRKVSESGNRQRAHEVGLGEALGADERLGHGQNPHRRRERLAGLGGGRRYPVTTC